MDKLHTTPPHAQSSITPQDASISAPGAARLRSTGWISSPLVFIIGHGLVDMNDAGPAAASSRTITTIALHQIKSGTVPEVAP